MSSSDRVVLRRFHVVCVLAAGSLMAAGCKSAGPPGPKLGPVGQMERPDSSRPLPAPEVAEPPGQRYDEPLVYQRPPEQKVFLEAYEAVGRPRLAVFVNRSLLGEPLPAEAPAAGAADPARGNPFRENGDTQTYLQAGQYDENYARQIDYATIENVLTQWLACEGQTTIASPAVVRERLNVEEVVRLQAGRPRQIGELTRELNADVLIYIQARPTKQTEHGLEIRLNAEAINIAHGEQIARASTLIPPPLDAEQMHQYTRQLARKLMSDMTMTWSGPAPTRQQASGTPMPTAPATPAPPPSEPAPAAPTKPAGPKSDLTPSDPPAPKSAPAGRPGVPPEKPSVLDRPEPASASRPPADDFPATPAAAQPMPE